MVDKYTKNDPGYYGGQLLVATPQIQESCFHKSLVYICVHNQFGAMGIIVNYPLPNDIRSQLYGVLDIEENVRMQAMVQLGGPVEMEKGFILHTRDFRTELTLVSDDGLYVTPSPIAIPYIEDDEGPERFMFTAGYAGWGEGQLEAEIRDNSWFTVPMSHDLVFDEKNDEKWISACRSIGVDPHMLSDVAGSA